MRAGEHHRIIGALVFAVVLVGGAYYLSRAASARSMAGVVITTTDTDRTYAKTKDTDSDGMPDWQEELRGTNPLVPDAFSQSTSTEGSGAPAGDFDLNTVTGRFSRDFFEKYLATAANGSMSDADKAKFINDAVNNASQSGQDALYARGDIFVSPSSDPQALHAYGNSIADSMTREEVPPDNELFIVQRALQTNSQEALKALDPILLAYTHMVQNTKATIVPARLVNEHLTLLNALLALHNDIVAMRNIFEDGLPGAVRVKRYMGDVDALYNALAGIRSVLTRQGVTYSENEQGIFFYGIGQ